MMSGPPATAPPWNAPGAPGPGGRGSSPPTAGAIAGHDPLGEVGTFKLKLFTS